MTTTTPATPAASRLRTIEGVYRAPGLHWVGDGFRVAGYFASIPNAATRLDPFLLLDYHPPYEYSPTTQPRGVGVHPHRGFETVTIAWEGSVAHRDSAGGGGVIGPGDVQWMTAASGILHKEYHEEAYAKRGGVFHMAQLWVNLPRSHKMAEPRYQPISKSQIAVVTLPDGAGTVRVIAGEFASTRGPAETVTPMDVFEVRLNPGGGVALPFPIRYNVALLVIEGDATIGDRAVSAEDFVVLATDGDLLQITARGGARFLVLAGEPIGEPIAQRGPFVMNSQEELARAFADFRQGKFGYLEG